jgi:hypothetical protein
LGSIWASRFAPADDRERDDLHAEHGTAVTRRQ